MLREFQESEMKILKVRRGSFVKISKHFQDVWSMFLEYLRKVSKVFQEGFEEVRRLIKRISNGVQNKFQGSFKRLSKKFQVYFKEVSRLFSRMILVEYLPCKVSPSLCMDN